MKGNDKTGAMAIETIGDVQKIIRDIKRKIKPQKGIYAIWPAKDLKLLRKFATGNGFKYADEALKNGNGL